MLKKRWFSDARLNSVELGDEWAAIIIFFALAGLVAFFMHLSGS
jgi:hypothetical protein